MINEDEYAILVDLIDHVDSDEYYSIQKVAKNNYVSTATVSRLCKKFDFGFREMKQFLKVEYQQLVQSEGDGQKTNIHQRASLLQHVFHENWEHTLNQIDELELMNIIELLPGAQNICILGIGISKIAGEYFCQRLQIIGVKAHFLEISLSAGTFFHALSSADLVFVFSRSGESELLINKIRIAQNHQKQIISIGSKKSSTISQLATHSIAVFGSTKSLDISNTITTYNLSTFFLIDLMLDLLLESYQK